ncbi:MAG: hypothetical protein AMXMBFR4_01990 [Candidatus Hydrogenedentota bacterium]
MSYDRSEFVKRGIRGRRGAVRLLTVFLTGLALSGSKAEAQGLPYGMKLSTPQERSATVEALRVQAETEKADAVAIAASLGMPVVGFTPAGEYFELIRFEDGRPNYAITTNVNAAISTAANLVRNTAPYNVNGSGEVVGVWDAGSVLYTHQEFGGRVLVLDGAASHYHATHVGGTIGAAGVTASALGMAPAVYIDSYDWNSDSSEMASRGMVSAGQAGTIQLSNHSYGTVAGWIYGAYSGNLGWHWFGVYGEREDRGFGQYGGSAQNWDSIAYSAPYYLIVASAGNDRDDSAPSNGTTFYYWNGGWQSKSYDSSTDPYGDGYDNGGYDTIGYKGNAKNILTVGATLDAVSGGVRYLPNGTVTLFSCWGPTDDGRVKPDLVGNGNALFSTDNASNSSYATLSGTSMSSPNVTGSAALLLDLYGNLFPGGYMLASTLKGLLIHTADDMGNAGPDYAYGWGMVDTEAAANHIRGQALNPSSYRIVESLLDGTTPSESYAFTWDGSSPIRATLCWTDPAGPAQSGLDITTPALVNDLDLRILGPGGSPAYQPFVLNGASPASLATTGDNSVDNIEQVLIAYPPTAGVYTVQVTHKGTLTNSQQVYSLLISGMADAATVATPVISPAGGSYAGSVNVTITCATSEATIRFTTDGTEPTSSSTLYSGAFQLTSSTTVKARAFKSGMSDSSVATAVYTITVPPTVLFPSASGITLTRGQYYNVQWTGFTALNVTIELWKTNALYLRLVAATPNDGEHTLQIPLDLPSASDYYMKVRSTTNAYEVDGSNSFFTISGSTVPLVEYPSARDLSLTPGQTYTILWAGFTSADVKIELWKTNALYQTLFTTTPNDGAQAWTVPGNLPTATDYYLKVRSTTDAWEVDGSNNFFRIGPPLPPAVVFPTNQNVTLAPGRMYLLRWEGFSSSTVKIELWKFNGTTDALYRIITNSTVNDNTEYWTVPTDLPAASDYYIKVRGNQVSEVDGSNWYMTIEAPSSIATLTNGVTVYYLSGNESSEQFFKITVPPGMTNLIFKTYAASNSTGDGDLYVRFGSPPTTSSYGYASLGVTCVEEINVSSPGAGDYYVMIHGYSAFSGMHLFVLTY